jgi:predicted transglutaminase-like cysteine proteinase
MFGDVKMFCRVAGWGLALLLLVSPAASGVETNSSVESATPSALAELAMTEDQIKLQPEDRAAVQPKDRAAAQPEGPIEKQTDHDTQVPVRLSALDPAQPPTEAPAAAEPFGLAAVPVVSGRILTKWSGVEADIRSDNEVLDRCRANEEQCPAAARNFLAIIAEGRAQSGRARIGVINRAINFAIRPMSDLAQWGVPDRWSSPLETFSTGRGDCEDYAIAKYAALMQAGIAADDLRLVIVHDLAVGENHAVVAVRFDGEWFVLDNRWLTQVADVEVPRTVPLFVLDHDGVKEFALVGLSGVHRAAIPSEGTGTAPSALRESQ